MIGFMFFGAVGFLMGGFQGAAIGIIIACLIQAASS